MAEYINTSALQKFNYLDFPLNLLPPPHSHRIFMPPCLHLLRTQLVIFTRQSLEHIEPLHDICRAHRQNEITDAVGAQAANSQGKPAGSEPHPTTRQQPLPLASSSSYSSPSPCRSYASASSPGTARRGRRARESGLDGTARSRRRSACG